MDVLPLHMGSGPCQISVSLAVQLKPDVSCWEPLWISGTKQHKSLNSEAPSLGPPLKRPTPLQKETGEPRPLEDYLLD